MSREVKTGMTDYTVSVFIPDPASTDGSGKTGLVAANLTVSGVRVETDNDVTVTDYTSSLNNLASLTAAHNDWGLLEVSNTLAPGLYRLDISDAIFASGAWSAVVYVMVTTSAAAATPMEFILTPQSPIDGVQLAPVTHTSAVIPTVTTVGTLTTYTGNTPQTGDTYARLGAPAGASVSADVALVKVDTAASKVKTDFLPSATAGSAGGVFIAGSNAATTANITGNLTGNVTGSVASVTAGVTVTTNNDKTGYAVGVGGIASTAFAAGAIDSSAIAANAIGASELAQDAAQEIADEILNRNLAGGGSGNTRNVRNALRAIRNKVSIAAGTLTVCEEDDTTPAWIAAVATTPGDPLSSIDPT